MALKEIVQNTLSGKIKPTQTAQEYLDKIAEQNAEINAFVHLDQNTVLKDALEIEKKLASGEKSLSLAGVPVAIKDNICTKNFPTTCASKILGHYVSPYNATVIKRLKEAGAVIIGKTNMDEFAMGSSNEHSAYGPVKNPVDTERTPGGSSGGSAAAVAADFCAASLGSDTGGSIRLPASFCGIVAIKPTYGRISRYGLVAFASSLDQIGPLAKNVEDTAIILNVISGHDKNDSTSLNVSVPDFTADLNKGVAGLKIGIPAEYFAEGLDEEVKEAVMNAATSLEKEGAELVNINLPHTEYAVPTYYIIAPAEASANLARYDGVRYGFRDSASKTLSEMYKKTRSEGFGPEVTLRIILGTFVLSSGYYDAYYNKALKVRTLIRNDFMEAFKKVDAVLTPVSPTTAFKIGEKTDDPLKMYLSDIFTIPCNLAGLPGIALPCGKDRSGLPIGMQLMGKHLDEATILRIANCYEKL